MKANTLLRVFNQNKLKEKVIITLNCMYPTAVALDSLQTFRLSWLQRKKVTFFIFSFAQIHQSGLQELVGGSCYTNCSNASLDFQIVKLNVSIVNFFCERFLKIRLKSSTGVACIMIWLKTLKHLIESVSSVTTWDFDLMAESKICSI